MTNIEVEGLRNKITAAEVLRKYQKQLDPEGIDVGVSRQALDEVLNQLEAAEQEIERLRDDIKDLERQLVAVIGNLFDEQESLKHAADDCRMLEARLEAAEQQLAEAKADAESWSAQSDKDVSMLNKEIEKNKRLREAIIKLEKASVHGMFGCDADDTNPFEKALYDLFDMIQAHKEEK